MSLHDVHHDEWVAGYNGYQCAVFEVYVPPARRLAVVLPLIRQSSETGTFVRAAGTARAAISS